MRNFVQSLLSGVVFLLMGCAPEQATVDGNPPVTPEVFFKAGSLDGTFQTNSEITAFMWPLRDGDRVLTREERISKRVEIIQKSELLSQTVATLKPQIIKIKTDAGKLEFVFVQKQCGLLAYDDPENPDDTPSKDTTIVPRWKDPVDMTEVNAIAECSENQQTRIKLGGEAKVLLDKIDLQKGDFVQNAIGVENFLFGMQSLKVAFNRPGGSGTPEIELVGFQNNTFSTDSEDEFTQIKSVKFDTKEMTLQFEVPYLFVSPASGKERYIGEYLFKMDINENGDQVSLAGDIERIDVFKDTVEIGRASFPGAITPFTTEGSGE